MEVQDDAETNSVVNLSKAASNSTCTLKTQESTLRHQEVESKRKRVSVAAWKPIKPSTPPPDPKSDDERRSRKKNFARPSFSGIGVADDNFTALKADIINRFKELDRHVAAVEASVNCCIDGICNLDMKMNIFAPRCNACLKRYALSKSQSGSAMRLSFSGSSGGGGSMLNLPSVDLQHSVDLFPSDLVFPGNQSSPEASQRGQKQSLPNGFSKGFSTTFTSDFDDISEEQERIIGASSGQKHPSIARQPGEGPYESETPRLAVGKTTISNGSSSQFGAYQSETKSQSSQESTATPCTKGEPTNSWNLAAVKSDKRNSWRQSIANVGSFVSNLSGSMRHSSTAGRTPEEKLKRHELRPTKGDKLWRLLEGYDDSYCATMYSWFMTVSILLSVLLPILATTPASPVAEDSIGVAVVDFFFDVLFAMEIIARFLTCPTRSVFLRSAFNVIDIIAGVTPLVFRASMGFSVPQRDADGEYETLPTIFLTVIPTLRFCRLLRRFHTFHLLLDAFQMALEVLPVLLFTMMCMVLIFSSLLFLVEPRDAMPSLPKAAWFTLVTMMTVGYGDMVPESTIGHLITSGLIIFSVMYTAIPLGIVGDAFSAVWRDRDRLILTKSVRTGLLSNGFNAYDIPFWFRTFDLDNDGMLCLNEFLAMMRSMRVGLKDERGLKLFKLFDLDGSGGVECQEFVEALFPQAYVEMYGSNEGGPMGEGDGALA